MFEALLDLFFPPRCFGCSCYLLPAERSARVCADCAHVVFDVEGPVCTRCGVPRELDVGVDAPCASCLSEPPSFDRVHPAFVYDGAVRDAIRRAKTSADPSTLLDVVERSRPILEPYIVERRDWTWLVPPVHPTDLRRRGWEPASVAARRLLKPYGISLTEPLRKSARRTKQALLGRAERRRAMRGAFAATATVQSPCVVFDDVMTTGATLDAVSRELKRAGAPVVEAIVLSRSV